MATGASGTITQTIKNVNLGTLILTVEWTQTYTIGGKSSTVTINAKLQRQYENGTAGGTWFAQTAGGISVDGVQVVGWAKDQGAGFSNQGQIGWQGSGSVTINHTAANAITITVSAVRWYNLTWSDSGFNVAASSDTVTLNAIQLGCAYIGNDRYVPYICVDGVYAQYEPYIGAADGGAWILQGG